MAERSSVTQLPGTHTAAVATPAIGATTSDEVVVWQNRTGASVIITGVNFCPDTAVTGAATNNMALSVRNKGTAGTSTTVVTTLKTYASGTDIAAFDQDVLTVTSTAADATIDNGESIALNKTENGTGLALPAGTLTIEYKFV